jgi:chemotaxis protein CheC
MSSHNIPEPLVDALLEIANVGVGRAAAGLSELTSRTVEINVPELMIFSTDQPVHMADLRNVAVLRVAQRFTQQLEGYTLLLLNEEGSRRVARLILGEEIESNSFDEMEQSALLELCNIMINSVMGTLANELKLELSYEVPFLDLKGISSLGELLVDLIPQHTGRVVFMRASLKISAEVIHGYIVLILDEENLQMLLSRLESAI